MQPIRYLISVGKTTSPISNIIQNYIQIMQREIESVEFLHILQVGQVSECCLWVLLYHYLCYHHHHHSIRQWRLAGSTSGLRDYPLLPDTDDSGFRREEVFASRSPEIHPLDVWDERECVSARFVAVAVMAAMQKPIKEEDSSNENNRKPQRDEKSIGLVR